MHFDLRVPRNKVGGFGTFVNSSALPIQLAWEAFGIKNGVPSLSALVAAIARYRSEEIVTPSTFIVCRVLVEPIFLPPSLWLDVPPSWSGSIMQGKVYRGDTTEGSDLWRRLEEGAVASGRSDITDMSDVEQHRFGEPVLIAPRLGQGAFRVAITELYQRQCALTDGKVLPALDAAHIRPFSEGASTPNRMAYCYEKTFTASLTLVMQRSTGTTGLSSARRSKRSSTTELSIFVCTGHG